MTSASILILGTVIAYLLMVLIVGFRVAKKSTDASSFFLGGRSLGPYVVAMSAEASDMSSYLLMGLPGLAYLTGLADVTWTAIGLAVGTYLNWLFVAKRLRRYTSMTNSFTVPQFFTNRFEDSKHIISTIAALVIIVFFVPYTASGFAACGKLFHSLFGADYMTAMLISAAIIVAYTTAGGFLAASLTDFIQGIFMTIALIAVMFVSVKSAGGISAVKENVGSLQGFISMSETFNGEGASRYGFLTVLSTLSWAFGYFGMPHILLRFMAIDKEDNLKVSRRVGSIWVVIAMALAIFIGVVGRSLSISGVLPVLSGNDSETIIVHIANFLAGTGVLPAIMAGIVIAGILASTMSTADSQLLAAASSVAVDLLHDKLGIEMSHKQSMLFSRLTVVGVAVLGAILARNPSSSIFKIVSFAWAGFGAAFGPVVILALFWKRATLQGAIAGMVSGGAMVFIWKFLIKPVGGVFGIYELLPAFVVALLVNVIVSLCSPAPSASVVKKFEEVKAAGK